MKRCVLNSCIPLLNNRKGFFLRKFSIANDSTLPNEVVVSSNLKMMFLGAPGVGKGTYASRVAPLLQIPNISTGDLVRHEIKNCTDLGVQVQEYNNKGLLVPDQIMIDMVKKRLQRDDAQKGFLLDGFPRNTFQAKALQEFASLDLVINIDLPDWILTEKILGRRVCVDCGTGYNVSCIQNGNYEMPPLLPKVQGVCDRCGGKNIISRKDDTEEIIRDRLSIYNKETKPLIDYYTEKGILRQFHVKRGLSDMDQLLELLKVA